MSREIQQDFKLLEDFIESYSLAENFSNDDFKLNLTQQHKRYYALLIFSAELNYQKFDPIELSNPSHDELKRNFSNFLAESISEIGSAFFIWLHGCYKVAQQTLRSSIENFFKGIGSIQFNAITEKKNTFEVIELVGNLEFFKDNQNRPLFEVLKTYYGALCASVHTATFQNMQRISALGYFPHFSNENAKSVATNLISISENFLSILCLMFPEVLYTMHFKNRDVIIPILDRNTRQILLEKTPSTN
jgi:hypothetical protein